MHAELFEISHYIHMPHVLFQERYVDIPQIIANQDMAELLGGGGPEYAKIPTSDKLYQALHVIAFNATAYLGGS